MTTASAETVLVAGSSSEASRATGRDNILPPSFPPATEQTPEGTGEQTPEGTGEQTPEGTGEQTPEGTGEQTPEGTGEQTPEGTGEQTPESTSYEGRGRQIIAGATEHARTGSKELFNRAKAGIKGIASILVRLARGGAKTVGEAAGKGASVAVGFAAIEGPKAAKATAKKVSELAGNARSRREAAKTRRVEEYVARQQARKDALGKMATRDAWIEAKIKEESAERGDKIEALEGNISEQKGTLEVKEAEVEAAASRVRKAERRLNKLEAEKKRAKERRNKAKDISDKNPDDVGATIALKKAEGDLREIEARYNAESAIKTSLEGEKEDLSSGLDTIRTGLGELQDQVNVAEGEIAAGKKWLRNSPVERAASSAFIRVAGFVDGPTAAHDLLRRAGRAIKRKFKGGNRQEAKTTA